MEKKSFSIGKYLCLGWLAIYLVISIFKFIQINYEINQKYGICAKKFMAVGYTNESIVIDYILLFLNRTVFPHFNPLYEYEVPSKMSTTIKLKAPFMDKSFSVTMRGGEIVSDNFYEVLSTDAKFQHMYSEWVKKQVGIDDENVELKFSRARCGAQAIGDDISIDFKNITSLANLNNEICENTHNYYICSNTYGDPGVEIIVNSIDSIEQLLKYADSIEKKIESRVFMHKHNTSREINQLFIDIFNKDGEKLLTICYDYDNKRKKFFKEENWIDYE